MIFLLDKNRIGLEKIVSDIQTRVIGVDVLAESILDRKHGRSAIACLIMDYASEIDQYLNDIHTLIHCEAKGEEIDV